MELTTHGWSHRRRDGTGVRGRVSTWLGPACKTGLGATLLSVGLALLAGCEPGQAPGAVPGDTALTDVFALEGVVELDEDPTDSIAQPGPFVERRRGGFILADRLLPRIRTYSDDGQLEAAFRAIRHQGPLALQARYGRGRDGRGRHRGRGTH